MTCYDCVHYGACLDMYDGNKADFNEVVFADQCDFFKNKADYDEIVRCKDCAYRKTNDCAMYYKCDCGSQYDWECDNDYCSYGKRKDT